jgi:excisionase family DNA binding protein
LDFIVFHRDFPTSEETTLYGTASYATSFFTSEETKESDMEQETKRKTYTVEQAAKQLGISRAKAYEACREGKIPNLRFGARVIIPAAAFDRLLEGVK